MATTQDQTLSEIVDLADIAVRAASQLRLAKANHALTDRESLARGLEFLDRATKGGAFMSGKSAQFRDTLRPLNWAADTYLTLNLSAQPQPDYDKVEAYLQQLTDSLRALLGSGAANAPTVDQALVFFEKLGDILGSLADQKLRREWSKGSLEM